MDVSAFQRVLVAGFIGGGTDDVDANLETVRLLRSQLRIEVELRVIEAEVLPLAEIAATKQRRDGATAITHDVAGVRRRRPQPHGRQPQPAPSRSRASRELRHPEREGSANATRASSRTSRSGRSSARNTRTR